MWDFLEEIKVLFQTLHCNICHSYRERNMVVDFLAKEGAKNNIYNLLAQKSDRGGFVDFCALIVGDYPIYAVNSLFICLL